MFFFKLHPCVLLFLQQETTAHLNEFKQLAQPKVVSSIFMFHAQGDLPFINLLIESNKITFLIDIGATDSLFCQCNFEILKDKLTILDSSPLISCTKFTGKLANAMKTFTQATIQIGHSFLQHNFYVLRENMKLSASLLGFDFFQTYC